MAQIFRHDDRPLDDLGLKFQGPPILSSSRSSSAHRTTRASAAADITTKLSIAPTIGRPAVVLQLPDLAIASATTATRRTEIVDLLSWIGIGVGAILAVALIWTAPKEAQPPMNEAPAWDRQVEPRASETSNPAVIEMQANEAPRALDTEAPPAPVEDDAPPAVEEQEPPSGHEHSLGSPFKERPEQAAVPATGETQSQVGSKAALQYPASAARPSDAAWDGNSSSARPGEAVPVGRITNVAVPE